MIHKIIEATGQIIRLPDGLIIPPDPANSDYQEYLTWVDEGGVAEIIPQSIPAIVSMRQARKALVVSGLLATVENTLQQLEGIEGELARVEWSSAIRMERESPVVQQLAGTLGLTEEDLDGLFALAATF